MKAPMVEIRIAEGTDAPAVASCLQGAFEPFRERYTPGAYGDTVPTVGELERRIREMTVLVAEDESGEAVGTIAYRVDDAGEGHLRGMAVLPAWQGTGVARKLLARAEEEMRTEGCRRVTLDTTEPLQRAMRFYERNGYRRTGVVSDFFGMALFAFDKRLR